MKVNRWDIFMNGRYIFHVYYTSDFDEQKIFQDLTNLGLIEEDACNILLFCRLVEKDK